MAARLTGEEPRSGCPNCGSAAVGRYCAECGQAAPRADDYSLRAHLGEFVDQVASMDGRALRTAWTLIASPGTLTVEHLAGRRARYLRPLQLFLLVNLLLFVVAPRMPMFSYTLGNYRRYAPPSPALVARMTRRAAPDSAAARAYTEAFDRRVESQRKGLIVLFAPILALILRVLFAWWHPVPGVPRRFGEHLVFALHVLAFLWLALAGWGVVGTVAGRIAAVSGRLGVIATVLALLVAPPLYLLLALRRVYRLGWPSAVLTTALLGVLFTSLLVGYRALLFFTTYYTL